MKDLLLKYDHDSDLAEAMNSIAYDWAHEKKMPKQKWWWYVIRVLLLPVAFILHLVPHLISIAKFMYFWVLYGGEFITYMKDDRASMFKIYEGVVKKKWENNETLD